MANVISAVSAALGIPNTGQERNTRCGLDEASRSSLPAVEG